MRLYTSVQSTEALNRDYQRMSALTPKESLIYLNTNESGLSSGKAADLLKQYGENSIKSKQSFHPARRFIRQLINLLAIMLWIASVLAILSGTPMLAYVIWAIILINALFSFLQEKKADTALQALSRMMPNQVKVYRDHVLTVLSADQLVPGDIVTIAAGDRVPADIRLINAEGLFVDNSMLTGESLPVDREAAPDLLEGKSFACSHNLLFAGTTVTDGRATAVVYATGNQTQIGSISMTTANITRRKSTLDVQIHKITRALSLIAIAIGMLAFMTSVLVSGFSVNAALVFAIGIIVANIPEGLMPTVSLSLALSVERMAKKQALVRKQSAVETLSSTTVICTDKTGTLTQNKIFAKKIWVPGALYEVSGYGYGKEGTVSGGTEETKTTLERLFAAASICSETTLNTDVRHPSTWNVIGSPTEAAILIASEKSGFSVMNAIESFKRIKIVPFTSNAKMMTVYAQNEADHLFEKGHIFQFTKGDPLRVLAHCGFSIKKGKVCGLSDMDRTQIRGVNDEMANNGFRVLAVAYADRTEEQLDMESISNDWVLLGLVIMHDPPKVGVKDAIADCYKAGIKVTIVTGDYALTAAAIARQIGIVKDGYVAITGNELEKMSQKELAKKIDTNLPVIFARTTPKDKLKIVDTYQSLGHVVASTGDGLNDVLALRKADIGISMGENGSDAAIESSDVVLLDDNFATIVEAIKEGRAIYENIRKFITYILASNVPEVLPFLIMAIFHVPLALNVLLVLAIDLGTDLIPAISLGKELPDQDVLHASPRRPNDNILNKSVLLRSYLFLGFAEAFMLFFMFFHSWNQFGYSFADIQGLTASLTAGSTGAQVSYVYQYAVTMAFGAVIFSQIGNLLECRSPSQSMFTMFRKPNHLIFWGILFEVALFLLIAYLPFMQLVFGTAAPSLNHLYLLLICPIFLIVVEESRKWVVRKGHSSAHHTIEKQRAA
ncbi:cation-transporting P-type ATPase [Sporolactobacillus sp. STCC-11]|uniref:cation-translocating P-type ATPase n=1 Tax=Sporolactobacillus caesalpiniae TaxID=3230362 RepID=UPI0033980FCB